MSDPQTISIPVQYALRLQEVLEITKVSLSRQISLLENIEIKEGKEETAQKLQVDKIQLRSRIEDLSEVQSYLSSMVASSYLSLERQEISNQLLQTDPAPEL
jgi:hypothetical protein